MLPLFLKLRPPLSPSFAFRFVVFTCFCLPVLTFPPNQAQCLKVGETDLFIFPVPTT